jgi:hypothetical protein
MFAVVAIPFDNVISLRLVRIMMMIMKDYSEILNISSLAYLVSMLLCNHQILVIMQAREIK